MGIPFNEAESFNWFILLVSYALPLAWGLLDSELLPVLLLLLLLSIMSRYLDTINTEMKYTVDNAIYCDCLASSLE